MNEVFLSSATIGVVISIFAYEIGVFLKKKTNLAICNPMLISILLIIGFLLTFKIEYESYLHSAQYLNYLLTPTTVCLAIPLYQKLSLLKENFVAIMISILTGVLASGFSILGMSILFGLTHEQYVTLLPKSITTAIGMGMSEELGGIVTITVASIVITGIMGNMLGAQICELFRVKHSISKGLALGTSTHAIGTARAMEIGEVEGAMSSLAMVVAGLCTVVAASIFAMLW